MKKSIVFLCVVTLSLGIAGIASALTLVDLHGDKDGFGIGVLPDQSFDFTAVTSEADDDGFTDQWVSGTQSWSHTYDISGLGSIQQAKLEVFTGGQGWYGQSELYVDGEYVGLLTDGDTFDSSPGANIARLDVFDLTAFASVLDGAETITVVTQNSGDGWVLDYSELTISDVPEPGTLFLLGVGLVGVLSLGRKKFIKR